MKKLYYAFRDSELNKHHEKYINLIIEEGTPKSSSWFSGVPSFGRSDKKIMDYFSSLKKTFFSGEFSGEDQIFDLLREPVSTVKFCPAFPGLFNRIFLIKTPLDIHLTLSRNGGLYWNMPQNFGPQLIEISNHHSRQFTSSKSNLFNDMINIKFAMHLNIGTEKKMPYMFLPPMYHNNVPWTVLQGVVEKEHTTSQPLNLNTMFPLPEDETKDYYIQEGTVLAYLFTMEPSELKMSEHVLMPKYKTKFFGKYFYPK